MSEKQFKGKARNYSSSGLMVVATERSEWIWDITEEGKCQRQVFGFQILQLDWWKRQLTKGEKCVQWIEGERDIKSWLLGTGNLKCLWDIQGNVDNALRYLIFRTKAQEKLGGFSCQ